LGRVSNLPTVWSNCLAAWLLSGGGSWSRFGWVCVGATLLYLGGMFLNDAFDQEFDRKHRSERPIIAGQIRASIVWVLGSAWLAGGWCVFFFLGGSAALVAALLVAAILLYDAVHKQTRLAPLVMAACRFLLYLGAGAAAGFGGNPLTLWAGSALALYIVGLSYLARGESTGGVHSRWPWLPLLAPMAIALLSNTPASALVWAAVVVQGVWLWWCMGARGQTRKPPVAQGVAGLLAGIVLVDWMATARVAPQWSLAFAALFIMALVMQRIAPAT
jgi:4-hydroxybenzoate polyprenyltransferase